MRQVQVGLARIALAAVLAVIVVGLAGASPWAAPRPLVLSAEAELVGVTGDVAVRLADGRLAPGEHERLTLWLTADDARLSPGDWSGSLRTFGGTLVTASEACLPMPAVLGARFTCSLWRELDVAPHTQRPFNLTLHHSVGSTRVAPGTYTHNLELLGPDFEPTRAHVRLTITARAA